MKKIIYLGIIGFGVYFIYKKYMKFTERLTYKINSIKFDLRQSLDSGFKTIFFKVDTNLINPENVRIKINNLQLFFSSENKTFAQIITEQSFYIEPKKTMNITLPLEIEVGSLPTVIINSLKNLKQGNLSVNIFGKISTELGELKFSEVKKLV